MRRKQEHIGAREQRCDGVDLPEEMHVLLDAKGPRFGLGVDAIRPVTDTMSRTRFTGRKFETCINTRRPPFSCSRSNGGYFARS